MKIKHFSGYGTVEAKKIKKSVKNGITSMHIQVKGNHECGLEPPYIDNYDVFNWLLKRFDRSVTDYTSIKSVKTDDRYLDRKGGVEVCDYFMELQIEK